MYIQPNWKREEPPLQIPENYSGTAMVMPSPPRSDHHEHLPEGEGVPEENNAFHSGGEPRPPRRDSSPEYPANDCRDDQKDLSGHARREKRREVEDEAGAENQAGEEEELSFSGYAPEQAGPAREKRSCESPRQRAEESAAAPASGIRSIVRGELPARFSFLSSLLPPKCRGATSPADFALIAGLLLLLADSKEDDILPLFLILLLA